MERKPIKMLIQSDIGADLLRTEIVKQAVKDYIHGRTTRESRKTKRSESINNMEDAERFLNGEWAEWLVDIDCKSLLRKVKERLDEKEK